MSNESEFSRSKRFWILAEKYLHMSRTVAEQIVLNENKTFVVSWEEITHEVFEKQTKWSDFNVVEPLLFNFYHGLELMLKGFILLNEKSNESLDHRLTSLLETFRERYPEASDFLSAMEKYLVLEKMPEILREFVTLNDISVDRFHESLRYPSDRTLERQFKHVMLKYKGRRGLPFYESLVADINYLMREAVKLSRNMEGSIAK